MQPVTRTAPGDRSTPLALALALALALLVAATAARRSARAEEPTLPTPPRQAESWTPPRTNLPRFLVSATAVLFDQGLADPRGCEYRTIHVSARDGWGGRAYDVATSGWVLPAADGGKPRHAIAWSGLVYPLTGVGGLADLDADVRALSDAAGKGRTGVISNAGRARQKKAYNERMTNERSSIAVASVHPIKICLLLRLGRADLAEAVWAACTWLPKVPKPDSVQPKFDLNSYGLSYRNLAMELAWHHFDRAISAHRRGDDPLALAEARALDALARDIDAKAEAMGFDRPDPKVRSGRATPYIGFLEQVPELLADQERRARERANPPAPPRGEGREARIAALIRNLDQVAERQWGQPGAWSPDESPIIQGLVAEGDAAVEPLIQALRSDDRLTRWVRLERDFRGVYGWWILGADQAAYTALTGILKTTNFTPAPSAGADYQSRSPKAVADQVQAYWEKNRAIPLVERWYRTLADDKADRTAWLEAADNITRPANVRMVPGVESLRNGHEPTVTALLARRIESMMRTPEGQRFDLLDPCRMAGMLADWDPVGSLPTLRDLTRTCREQYAWASGKPDLAVSIARFTLARNKAGDAGAVREYAEWVRTIGPDWLEGNVLKALEPLYRRPDDPTLAAAAAWLFGDPQSPWVPLIGRKGSRPSLRMVRLIDSPLVEVPAFRKMLLAALDDRSPAGSAEVIDNNYVQVALDGSLFLGQRVSADDRDAPARGVSVPIRMCDFYAGQLARLEGAPAFNPCWPESRRNAGVAAMAAFLKRKKP